MELLKSGHQSGRKRQTPSLYGTNTDNIRRGDKESVPTHGKKGTELWSLNVRGMSTKESLEELEQEAELSGKGILLVQETWRPEHEERIIIGKWTFFGTGNKERPRGNGTGILVHQSIEVESWYHIAPRITGIRIAYGDKHLTIFSIYAPVQQGRNNSHRTSQFYETLTDKTKEAKGRGDLVIIGGDWNVSIQQHNAPGLIGKWASAKESTNSENMINFMLEHKNRGGQHVQADGMEKQIHVVKRTVETMIDFFLCPMHVLHWHYDSEHRCGKWNMHSDHRTIHLRLPEATHQKQKRRTHRKKREVRDPREFGERSEAAMDNTEPSDLHKLDEWFAEIANTMKEKIPRRRIAQDPRIKERIKRRIALPRSHDGRARKELTQEIRKIIRTDTRNKKKRQSRKHSPDTPTGQKRQTNSALIKHSQRRYFASRAKPQRQTRKP